MKANVSFETNEPLRRAVFLSECKGLTTSMCPALSEYILRMHILCIHTYIYIYNLMFYQCNNLGVLDINDRFCVISVSFKMGKGKRRYLSYVSNTCVSLRSLDVA